MSVRLGQRFSHWHRATLQLPQHGAHCNLKNKQRIDDEMTSKYPHILPFAFGFGTFSTATPLSHT